MSDIGVGATLSLEQIATIAGVGRSAVSNWRKRHRDFPIADSTGQFPLDEVERWLIENGKIDQRISASHALWSLLDDVRATGIATAHMTDLVVAALVFLHAADQMATSTADAQSLTWRRLREASDAKVASELLAAATSAEEASDRLAGLVVHGLRHARNIPGALLRRILDVLERAIAETPSFDLYEQIIDHLEDLDRFRSSVATPPDLTELLVRLAGVGHSTVVDLAAGQADVLLSFATRLPADTDRQLLGFEINEDAARLARARSFLYDVDIEVQVRDALRTQPTEVPRADVVIADAPLSQRDWGDADLYVDPKWSFGPPPRRDATFAWIQTAIQALRPGGRALVVTALGPLSRTGTEAAIRHSLVNGGAVEAVIQLPGRIRTDASVPLAIWILRHPDDATVIPTTVLIDATELGTTGRVQHRFDESELDLVVALVDRHRSGRWDELESAIGEAADEPSHPVSSEPITPRPGTKRRKVQAHPTATSVAAATVAADDMAWVITPMDLEAPDFRLDPQHYRPAPFVDVERLATDERELRDRLTSLLTDLVAETAGVNDSGAAPSLVSTQVARIELRRLVSITRGRLHERPDASAEGFVVFGVREVRDAGQGPIRLASVDDVEREQVTVHAGDLVLALVGGGHRAVRVTERHDGAVLGKECAVLRVQPGAPIDLQWLHAWLHSTDFATQASRRASSLGTMSRINTRDLADLQVPVPDAEAQRAIVDDLAQLDRAIDAVASAQNALSRLRSIRTDLLISGMGR